MDNPRKTNRVLEENTLAILDSSGIRDHRDVHDDRLCFLEAVRSASLISGSSAVPTWKMYNAVFHILRDATSLEEAMTSFQLLIELEKCYPRLYLVDQQKSGSSLSRACELVVVKEAWSPFITGQESVHIEGEGTLRSTEELLDASGFSLLTQEIAQAASSLDCQLRLKLLKDMLLFQYLVEYLEGDFILRQTVYKETMNWVLLRESWLNMLLASRKINFRNFVRDCMLIIHGRFGHHAKGDLHDLQKVKTCLRKTVNDHDATSAIAMSELEKKTCSAVEKLLTVIMELDIHKKEADIQGCTSRADTVRIPLLEIIVDELSYDKDAISPFLQGFSEPKWKLEIVLQYFWKYCNKSSVRTRRSNDSPDDATFEAVLKYFSNAANTRSLVRRMSAEVTQLLLAHAFQAYLSLQHGLKLVENNGETSRDNPLLQISKDLISAFENIKKNDADMDILPFETEALFTAATILALGS
uniref:5-methylthioadenosine/S-adenosylhomocysteine deaminase n=1 Tax=Anthurium amnicola TaxID=1678845 RepID=A0A1D1Z9U2_9ARAE